ncbi:hypothetical protein BD770DRAFT_423623 [Pilaira anomala]|nr:hypothetical protein BD770DRAFT_423623 [Pilaira anomala]
MTSSIDKGIQSMIDSHAYLYSYDYTRKRAAFLAELNHHLLGYKPEGWSAFFYGSFLHELAMADDAVDICVTNTRSSTTSQQPIITQDNVNFERSDVSNNTADVVNVENLATHLVLKLGKSIYNVKKFFQAPVPFFTATYRTSVVIGLKISVDNTLDVERSNLITEYLSLDKRIKPFLFALKQFIKKRGIDNEENGYPSSYVFVMMGLYFLMFVKSPPVIPCLHSMLGKESCNYPVCRSKINETVQGFDVKYHDCARIDRIAKYNTLVETKTAINVYGTPWTSYNETSAGGLLFEAFKWFSYTAAILEPKSINSKEPPVLQPEWECDFMVFADVFNPKLNIAASCTVEGAKIINQEFYNAYIKLKEGASLEKVFSEPDTILTPVAIKPYKYKRGISP